MPIKPSMIAAALLLVVSGGLGRAEAAPQAAAVTYPSAAAASVHLSDLPPAPWAGAPTDMEAMPSPRALPPRGAGPGAGQGLEHRQGPGAAVQPLTGFGGIGANGFIPPDPNIAVGKNVLPPSNPTTGYIVQVVNSQVAVFDKTGAVLTGPVGLGSLWTPLGGACAGSSAGDPIVQYDNLADRWLIAQLGSLSAPFSECIAVSQTNDPRGAYFLYSYDFGNNLNDYPKFGVWPTATNSAYLATYNLFANGQSFVGAQLCAYDRTAMTSGATAPAQVCFTVPNDGSFLPSDLDGATAPADGTPGYFLNFETLSSLRLYQLSPNFATASGTLTQVAPDLTVASFAEACNGGVCIPQPNNQKLDSLGDRLMYRLAYRVFGDGHVAMVVNHSVAAGSSVGVRWYELRQSAASSPQCGSFTSGAFYLCQQGTFAPSDGAYRWMGSTAMDGAGNIAIGYSKSSSSVYPSIAFAGRTAAMPQGVMSAETILVPGNGAQTTYNRWGDYTSLRIDPSDDTTFWYTNEYYKSNGPFNYFWATAITSFTVTASAAPPDFTLSASPTTVTVTRGSSGSTTVSTTASNGPSSVNLSVSGLPKFTNASFAPNPVTTPNSSQLTISANRNARTGTYIVTVSGNNGSASHNTTLTVVIQ